MVGDVEDAGPAAAVDRQRQHRGGTSVGQGEVLGEREDVARRGPAPPVDRLERVPHSSHGVAHPPAGVRPREQASQQQRLGGGGVLVLIEQHDLVLLAQLLRDRPDARRDARRSGHLVGELDVAGLALELLVGPHERGQFQPLTRSRLGPLDRLVDVAAVRGRVGELQHERPRLLVELGVVHEVRLELAVEREHPLGHRLRPQPRQLVERSGRRRHHARRQSVARGARDHGRVGLVPQPEPVLRDQPRGERVVRQDDLLAFVVDAVGAQHAGRDERSADAVGQLGGRLAREGEAEHLARTDLACADEPDDPCCHHRGLPGPGAGDDDSRLERRGDRRELLVAERHADGRDQVIGCSQRRLPVRRAPCRERRDGTTHEITCRPSPRPGQLDWNGQYRHW